MSTQDALGLWEQQVLQRGIQTGIEQGIEQGRLAGPRAALRRVLDRRGLKPGAEDDARIEACRDVGTLERWRDQVLTSTSVAELRLS